MSKIILYFITHRRVANLILLLIVIVGILSALVLKRQSYPTIDFDIVKIITAYPGAGPEDVEINVTEQLEDEILEVEDIDEIISRSMENLSMITIYLNPDARDVRKVKNDIRDAVDRVSDLPEQVTEKPYFMEFRSSNRNVLEIGLTGNVSEKELRLYAKSLANDLKRINGMGRITKVGYNKREIKIEADQDLIRDRYVSLGEIMGAIRSRNVRTTGGSIESYVSEKNIVTFSEYRDPMSVRDVIIRSTFSGTRVRISDIAEIEDGFEEPEQITHADSKNAISLLIKAQENTDVITLADKVKEELEVFKKGLPDNVDVKVMYDDSMYTRNLLKMVANNGLIGFILVLGVMFFFLDRKSAFWTALALPIAICGSLIFFNPLKITINSVTLVAVILVLGMLVDHAIVITEKIYQLKERGMRPAAATVEGLKSVFWPVVAAVVTTVLAFVPMLFMKGLTGKFVASIPVVVMLMLFFSLLEATVFLPSHIIRAKPPDKLPFRMILIKRVVSLYGKVIMVCLRFRTIVLSVFALVFVLVMFSALTHLNFVLFPQVDPDVFNMVIEAPGGTPLEVTEQKVSQLEQIMSDVVPEEMRESYTTRIGHHDTGVYGASEGHFSNWAMITVYLKPAEQREQSSGPVMEELQNRLDQLEGFIRLTVEPIDEGPPVGKPITVTYTTDDDNLRRQFETETIKFLQRIDGVYDIESTDRRGKEELRLYLDYDEMARFGITAIEVAKTMRAAFEGEVVTSIRTGGEEVDFRVSLREAKKFEPRGVLDLEIVNQMGKLVPLKNFAHFEETVGTSVIYHYDGIRSVTINAEVDPDKITSVKVNDMIREEFNPKTLEHPSLKMFLGGEEKRTKESVESFLIALVIAVIAIYFLLVILFNSYIQPLLIMTAIPFAVVGVLLTLMLHNLPVSFVAMVGMLGLVGVVVNDAIVMVSQLNDARKGFAMRLSDVAEVARGRFRPILLTTFTTAAGLLPIAYGIGGDVPFIRPMVLVMAWGLLLALFVSLIFIPVMYSIQVRAKK